MQAVHLTGVRKQTKTDETTAATAQHHAWVIVTGIPHGAGVNLELPDNRWQSSLAGIQMDVHRLGKGDSIGSTISVGFLDGCPQGAAFERVETPTITQVIVVGVGVVGATVDDERLALYNHVLSQSPVRRAHHADTQGQYQPQAQ